MSRCRYPCIGASLPTFHDSPCRCRGAPAWSGQDNDTTMPCCLWEYECSIVRSLRTLADCSLAEPSIAAPFRGTLLVALSVIASWGHPLHSGASDLLANPARTRRTPEGTSPSQWARRSAARHFIFERRGPWRFHWRTCTSSTNPPSGRVGFSAPDSGVRGARRNGALPFSLHVSPGQVYPDLSLRHLLGHNGPGISPCPRRTPRACNLLFYNTLRKACPGRDVGAPATFRWEGLLLPVLSLTSLATIGTTGLPGAPGRRHPCGLKLPAQDRSSLHC